MYYLNTLMENIPFLCKLGFSKKEDAIYNGLLHSGPATISQISKNTGLYRPAIYKILPRLIDRGIISRTIKGKLHYFAAESPQKLQPEMENYLKEIEADFLDAQKIYSAQSHKPIIKFFEGKRGIQKVHLDIAETLNKGDICYRYSSRRESTNADKYLPTNYKELREKKGWERFVITSPQIEGKKKPRLDRAVKTIPSNFDIFEYDITQIIYRNKIAFLDYNTETAFIVENGIMAEFQKKVFQLLYSKL